ncbi:helix-turn-helix transcriptional regulator [Microbacterium sp. STF-2]|uniref:response regulator transcription factor n=1 Tax=Microbacterium sp. STF-2 TaxID=3031132 RepID=UPI002AFFAF39|nr:helix-turn-helix transcriptional regulator [Microbacterium sp. STF-2]MEA1262194.1 helix-turn-helix transcriptional regulator [Microbacterium sp. STF-2]
MLARLAGDLDADAATIRAVVERLTPHQRHGLRPLPSPLPLVAAISRRFEGLLLDERDRQLLLALAVCLDDSLGPLLEFDGRTATEIAAAAVGDHLSLHAGRVRFVDARLSIWVRATTCTAGTALVHERLSAVFLDRGDPMSADWHRARASLEGDPSTARELTLIARQLSEAGHPERALMLAREAAEHAVGEDQDEARLVAGASAVGAGFAVEAAAWLGTLYPHSGERHRWAGLGALIVAQTFVQGAVPGIDPTTVRPGSADESDWRHWTRAAALAAILCAERGDRRGMRLWLDALRDGAVRIGAEQELRDPVVALGWLVAGDRDADMVTESSSVSGGMLRTLRAAVEGDIDLGLRLLVVDESTPSGGPDPFVPGYEHSPVVHAYRSVVEVLLLAWRGDIGVARDRLIQAALTLPIALPLAGLGVVLARRLDLAVHGELGPFARSLTLALPPGAKMDLLVDRGIRSFLSGSFDDAAATVRLWSDLGAPQTTMTVPGLDELASPSPGVPLAAASLEPPEIALAQQLRTRIATAADGRWRADGDEIAEIARTLRSPFERARVEMMLGSRHATRDDHSAARIHLQYAERLFELSGATAWAKSVRRRLDRLEAREGSIVPAVGPLSACRAAWSLRLTARELEVAMRAVRGAANREIGEELNVSVRTVEVHLGRIFTKLDVRSRVELTVLAHRTDQHV